ncbi:hypothetical protein HanIR_Chr09g0412771 [Helianthus annuus]|nr:hypothetical protein HanIR_Chr09g0412771 [Helianthus annuus]
MWNESSTDIYEYFDRWDRHLEAWRSDIYCPEQNSLQEGFPAAVWSFRQQ